MKQNCWEYMNCGRELGAAKAGELGICVAALQQSLNNVHGGLNAGRACWVVAGTLCGGEVQGSFVFKTKTCIQCDFFKLVCREEGSNVISPAELLEMKKAG
jgi:hypothetical protein